MVQHVLGRLARRRACAAILAALLAGSAGGAGVQVTSVPIAVAQAATSPIYSRFTCQGSATQTYTVPDGITHVLVAAAGGAGAGDDHNSSRGGLGALVQGVVNVLPGDQIGINVGCAANGRTGGAGGDGLSISKGGDGGRPNYYGDGGGGGGASGVFDSSGYNTVWHVQFQGFDFVAGGGGGGSGYAGLSSGHDGGNAGLNTANPQSTSDGGRGLGSVGGGGGGGGGAGYRGGAGGGGGSRLYAPGHAGDGGSSAMPVNATNAQVVSGGGPRGDGFVLITPLIGQRPIPTLSYFQCQNGTVQSYTVPARVTTLQVLVDGASGSDQLPSRGGTRGGAGAQVLATVPVSAGQVLSVEAGCRGGGTSSDISPGGPGYGNGGRAGYGNTSTGTVDQEGTGGGGGSAILDRTGQPLIVAGGGGGAGGPGPRGQAGAGGDGSALGNNGQAATGSRSGSAGNGGAAGGRNGSNGQGTSCAIANPGTGGGGGGGYRVSGGGGGTGGQSGGCAVGSSGSGGGGGGGASYLAPSLTGTGSIAGGVSRGDGLVVIAAAPPGVPLAPTLLQATGSPLQATVSFVTPVDDGGSPITSYTVTSNPDGITATGTGSPIVVTGLTRQVPYTFTVHATNAVGNGTESAPSNSVTTVFLPGAPSITTITPGDSRVAVAFTPPASNGGRPITQYTAIARLGSASSGPGITATGTSSPITISGLTNGTTYSVSVYATTALGNGPESLSIPAVPLTLPGAPTQIGAAVGPGGVSISFTPPSSTGGSPITGYTVTSSPGGITASGTTSPIQVSGLTNGTSYTFTVHATTAAGNGPESVTSNPVIWVSSTALSPPLLLSAAPGNQQATISFHAPLDDGGSPVTSYIVTSSPGGIAVTGTTTTITVTGLTNGVSYTFSAVAVNANGTSQPSTPSNAVTPSASYGPPNDDFANAQPITGDVGSVTGTNIQATKEPGEPDHNGNPGGASVWYAWTTTNGGSIEFYTCGSSFTTDLGLYEGSSVDALTGPFGGPIYRQMVRCPDGTPSLAVFSDVPQGGGTFYIAVDGDNEGSGPATGNFVLNWTNQTGQ